jgi:hypothetical protein
MKNRLLKNLVESEITQLKEIFERPRFHKDLKSVKDCDSLFSKGLVRRRNGHTYISPLGIEAVVALKDDGK